MSKIYMVIAGLVMAFAFVGFQNCSNDASFDIGDSTGSVAATGNGETTPGEGGNSGAALTEIDGEGEIHGQILELHGECDGGGQSVSIDGPIIDNTSCGCDGTTQTYTVCTLITEFGQSSVNISQIGSENNSQLVTVPINVTQIYNWAQYMTFTSIVVTSLTSADVIINCEAGANITAKIYTREVLNENCGEDGSLRFTVSNLVGSLEGSGNRILTVTQTSQTTSEVTTISADVDNANPAHECGVSSWEANAAICSGYAGGISGTCKAGLPVRIMVNGALQQIVPCSIDGGYTAENVLLTDSDLTGNQVSISQDNPFDPGQSCSADFSSF